MTTLLIVQVNDVVAVKPAESVAVITTAYLPAVVGVPVTAPVDPLRDSPVGSVDPPVKEKVAVDDESRGAVNTGLTV